MITAGAHYLRGVRQPSEQLTIEAAAEFPRSGGSFVWLELSEPSQAELHALCAGFGLHELALEDVRRAHQRPKVEPYDDFYFLVFRTARNDARHERVHFGEVHVFLGTGFVIVARHGEAGPQPTVRPHLLKHGPAAAVWAILHAIVADLGPVVEEIENEVQWMQGGRCPGAGKLEWQPHGRLSLPPAP